MVAPHQWTVSIDRSEALLSLSSSKRGGEKWQGKPSSSPLISMIQKCHSSLLFTSQWTLLIHMAIVNCRWGWIYNICYWLVQLDDPHNYQQKLLNCTQVSLWVQFYIKGTAPHCASIVFYFSKHLHSFIQICKPFWHVFLYNNFCKFLYLTSYYTN